MITNNNENYKIYENLSRACAENNINEFKKILKESNYDINYVEPKCKWNILLTAVYFNFIRGVNYLMSNKIENIDINNSNSKAGDSPLLLAIALEHEELCKLLLNYKDININKANEKGMTPVMSACSNKSPKYLQLLMKYKPNFNLKDKTGKTALDYANLVNNSYAKSIIEKEFFNQKIVVNPINYKKPNNNVCKI